MEYWLGLFHEGNDQVCEIARAAEALGYTGIALPDHVAIPVDYRSQHPSGRRHIEARTAFPEPFITAASMAAVTTRLRFMTYVYVLPMREPFSVAKQVATLAMQSGYRFSFGVGAGWNTEEIQLLGHDPATRGARMDEMITIMRDFWEDGMAAFDGCHYRFPPVGQFPVPRLRIPVLIGGKSVPALRRAACNDGWLGMNYPMEEIAELLERLQRERERYLEQGGIDRGDFRKFVMPEAEPGREVYARLEAWGVDGTIVMPWPLEDPAFAPLERKFQAMRAFAEAIF